MMEGLGLVGRAWWKVTMNPTLMYKVGGIYSGFKGCQERVVVDASMSRVPLVPL